MTAGVMSIVLLVAAAADQLDTSSDRGVTRELCGPIAVRSVLQHYGVTAELPGLTEEIFGEGRGPFSSMAALNASLQRHGLHTLALNVGEGCRIDWWGPVIIHLPPRASRGTGHFAVILPNQSTNGNHARQTVSLSPGVTVLAPWDAVAAARSRTVLLTSADPIDRKEVLNGLNRRCRWTRWAVVVLGGMLVACLYLRFSHRRSLS